MTPALEPSCHKRARREEIGGNSGRVEDDRCSPRLKLVAGETRADDPAHPEVIADAVPYPAAAPETDSTPTKETTPAGVVTPPPPTTEDVTAGNDAAIHASSNPPSQEGAREAAVGAAEEAPVRARPLELPGPAAQTPSSLELVPSVQDVVPAAGTRAGVTIDSLLLRLVSSFGEASQGLLTTRVARDKRGDDLLAPEAVTKGASSGKALVAVAGSSIGSLSSASQLQQEWANTASSADAGEKLKVQGSKLTLAELDKQFAVVKGSLQNAGFQLLDAIRTTNVSTTPLASGFFC
jgi:hypothetical protein